MQPFFITSTGTDIGKTLVTAALCFQLKQQGKKVTALKPVVSGYDPDDSKSDPAIILQSCGLKATPELMRTIAPWHFKAPLSPDMAAAREGKKLDLDKLVSFARDHAAITSDVLLVEGAGGIMTPLNDRHTMLDWMTALGWPVLLVTGNYLGSISHTLTSLEVLKNRKIPIRALIISESERSPVTLLDTVSTLEKFVSEHIPIVKIPRIKDQEECWKQVPTISWLCDA